MSDQESTSNPEEEKVSLTQLELDQRLEQARAEGKLIGAQAAANLVAHLVNTPLQLISDTAQLLGDNPLAADLINFAKEAGDATKSVLLIKQVAIDEPLTRSLGIGPILDLETSLQESDQTT